MDIDDIRMKLDAPELEFDEGTHTYTLFGAVIPSVTTIMKPLSESMYARINDDVLANAARRGTIIHNSIENWIKFQIDDIPIDYIGYLDAFKEWWNYANPVVVGSEIRTYHKLSRYGGTIDLLCYIGDELTLVDYKSTSEVKEMTCGVQLEAYAQALASHGIYVDRKEILHLKKNGGWKSLDFKVKDAERWRVFGSLKTVYDYIGS